MSETLEGEQERLKALQRYQILDTPPDGAFDRITAIAAQLFNVPIAITSLVDTDRIWFKSHHGIDVEQVDRVPGLCASVILDNVPYILNDASMDPRSLANPLVAGDFGLRFYAGVPLTTSDNHNLGVFCVIDFEPRTVTEQEMEILKQLARVVMDEMELRLASRRIVELNKEKNDLLAILSHEIRTPMNGIMGMASLLHSIDSKEEQKNYIDIIESSGEALLTLLDRILDYSKLESETMELYLQPFDFRSCMYQVKDLFAVEAASKGILFHTVIDPAIPEQLTGDKDKIRQILINLAGNALKFTRQGEITLEAKLLSTESGYAAILFRVTDTGIGIRPDQQGRLFLSFTQVHSTVSKDHYGGTGLGLSICRRLVEFMNGRIWLAETSEKGSTFAFEIKLAL